MSEITPLGEGTFEPTEQPDTIELDSITDWIERLELARKTEKIAKEKAEEAKQVIASKLGDAEFGTVGGALRIRNREVTTNRFDTTKFRAEYPELAEAFNKSSTTYRMEIVKP